MKIDASAISLNSSRAYQKTISFQVSTSQKSVSDKDSDSSNSSQNRSATISLSQQGQQASSNFKALLRALDTEAVQKQEDESSQLSDKDKTLLEVMKRMLEMLRRMLKEKADSKDPSKATKLLSPDDLKSSGAVLDLTSSSSASIASTSIGTISETGIAATGSGVSTGNTAPAVFTRTTTTTSTFFEEAEVTNFASTGLVRTSDGREINFNIDLELSRSFMEQTSSITESTQQILTDPLVINLDVASASVTDQKFLFDINSDGTKETVSFVGEGSGFLALDQNKDGIINNGSELFGTQSGDGFADLATHDADQNGWIDENDKIFSDLKIWTKDAEGTNQLIDLKSAGVGAIFLGNVSTEFSLNDIETNEQNAQIRSTGVYLKESGAAGTIQHVDLAL